MSAEESKLRQRQREEETAAEMHREQSQVQGVEFGTVEELLRYDSEQNPVPREIEERLERSVAAEPRAPRLPWYRRLFG